MTTYRCPNGHDSGESDYCDTCGALIGSAPADPPTLVDTAPRGELCPHCGTPRAGSARFCEDCGYDHTTGKVPQLTEVLPIPAAPAADWTATVVADPAYFAMNAVEGVSFPADTGERTITLTPPQVRIGRASSSKGTSPEIDLADTDPGVSHNHALLTLNIDGVWLVTDLGSTNGTYLNDEDQPLTAGQSRTLKDGDQVHVGVWTTFTLHAPE
ncbi:Oxoglutarate dehydrogenase inhibitor [Actinoplanes sp. SE50]|uniref:FHA domain-containing protein n=1 Tax=unclassified Actinoplanes TaxID=2626549 RepID=UPI00023ED0DC|nr:MULTISPECIES: FHA domain-containing protein [unclassified Actinoplanes]AEV86098.1 Oxoglutarate dehydrogenase inhibitor [Actinoplanes sp. SE50/110]ATO84496.1 Oxoglutarate dehydrogenase inhibitor [Actinoplanes sp. SE50]SLM01906.1 Oxoglutarate dehydrogenase inhibitor [Actinoplanes sp. SE50/110]